MLRTRTHIVAVALMVEVGMSGVQTLVNSAVQLRHLATNTLAGTTMSSAAGQFSFIGLNSLRDAKLRAGDRGDRTVID